MWAGKNEPGFSISAQGEFTQQSADWGRCGGMALCADSVRALPENGRETVVCPLFEFYLNSAV